MTITMSYSAASAPSARAIAEASDGKIELVSYGLADINWGRAGTSTAQRLNNDISTCTNKRQMREMFSERGVPAPPLFSASEAYEAISVGPLVGRPDRHTRGKGFWLCRNTDDVVRALRGTRRKAAATHFMLFVNAPREFRVHVFDGKSIRISMKEYVTVEGAPAWKRNYLTVKPPEGFKRKPLREAAKAAVAAVGLDFGAVDILVADDGAVFVLEVNAAPGLGGSMPRVWADTFVKHFAGREES